MTVARPTVPEWSDAWFAWLDAERLDPTLPLADFEDEQGRLPSEREAE